LRALEIHEESYRAPKFKYVLSTQLAYPGRMDEIGYALLRVLAHEALVPAVFVLPYSTKIMLAVGRLDS
jgi:hypothetical protein